MQVPGEQLFKVIQNPNHRSMLAWSWIAIMSLAIALVAGRQLIVVERQKAVILINTEQSAAVSFHERRIDELEIWRAEADLKLKMCVAHAAAGVK